MRKRPVPEIRVEAIWRGVEAIAKSLPGDLSDHEVVGAVAGFLAAYTEAAGGSKPKVTACVAYQLCDGDRAALNDALDEVWEAAR